MTDAVLEHAGEKIAPRPCEPAQRSRASRIMLTIYIAVGCSLFIAPTAQNILRFAPPQKLAGVEYSSAPPRLSFSACWNGEFQKNFEQWYGQVYGLREHLVRTAGQIDYDVFGDIPMKEGSNLIIGTNGSLLTRSYIFTYYRPSATKPAVDEFARKLRDVQVLLQQHNVGFLFFITPAKPSVCPELIPDQYAVLRMPPCPATYLALVERLKHYGVNTLDARATAVSLHTTLPTGAFPKGGIHWNYNVSLRVAQQLLDRFSELRHRPLARLQLERIDYLSTPPPALETDEDLALLANLWDHSAFSALNPYPVAHAVLPLDGFKPNVLFVGGSFLGGPVYWLTSRGTLDTRSESYWYFSQKKIRDVQREIYDRDVVVLECNEAAVWQAGNNFPEAVLEAAGAAVAPHPSDKP